MLVLAGAGGITPLPFPQSLVLAPYVQTIPCLCNSPLHYVFLKYWKGKKIDIDVLFGTRGKIPLKWRLIILEGKVIPSKRDYCHYMTFLPATASQQTRKPAKIYTNQDAYSLPCIHHLDFHNITTFFPIQQTLGMLEATTSITQKIDRSRLYCFSVLMPQQIATSFVTIINNIIQGSLIFRQLYWTWYWTSEHVPEIYII